MKHLRLSHVACLVLAIISSQVIFAPVCAQAVEYRLTPAELPKVSLLGASVAISDDRALVGAPEPPLPGVDTLAHGAAYLFEPDENGSWVVVAKLTATDGTTGDVFGRSVSISGERALVGAYGDDAFSGSAYLFEQQDDGSWIEVAKLTASDREEDDRFGESVALQGDRALVGAYGDDGGGSAYLFERQDDGSWMETTQLTASDRSDGKSFGTSVSLSDDHALIGDSNFGGVGSAYVFERQPEGDWIETTRLTASGVSVDIGFGSSVSLSGNRAIVGAQGLFSNGAILALGSAYVFEMQPDGSWQETARLSPPDESEEVTFGCSVSQSNDRVLVGSPTGHSRTEYSGSAYLYERQPDGSWQEVIKMISSDGASGDSFGQAVALSGEHAVIGAWQKNGWDGAAYLFDALQTLSVPTEETPDLPESYHLSTPYPNPFKSQTNISLTLPKTEHITLEVVDVMGRRIDLLHHGTLQRNTPHRFTFHAGSLPNGLYLLRATGRSFTTTRTLTLVK